MNKLNTLILIFFLFSLSLSAQMWNGIDTLYGNEWIDFDRTHYKVMVAEDGIYKISAQTMANNGIPNNAIQNDQLRLYYMGQEVPIFNSSDGIEFYGKKNRSQLDKYLFENPEEEMANPEYSLFTDSSAYFLTWDNTVSTSRFQNTPNNLSSAPSTPEPYCTYTEKQVFSDDWSKIKYPSGIYFSRFENAEGFVSPFQLSQTITLATPSIFTGSTDDANLDIRYVTINQSDQSITHEQQIKLNGTLLATDNFIGPKTAIHNFTLAPNTLTPTTEVTFEGLFNNNDQQGVAYVKLTYPRSFDFGGKNSIEFKMPASSATQYLKITNFNGGSSPVLYDLTNNLRIVGNISGSDIEIALPASTSERKLMLVNGTDAISQVTNLINTNFIDYNTKDAEYIIISNKNLFNDSNGNNWVQEYANYRSTLPSRNYVTEVVEIQQLYDQFSYGVNRHSISIRNFGHFIKKIWTNPQYVFLVGKGRSYDNIRTSDALTDAISDGTFHIPTFGTRGGGDNLLLTSTLSNSPIISIGRIPATNSNDVRIYLDKVMAHENAQSSSQSIPNKEWMKRMIHLGGGNTNEQAQFRGYLNALKDIIENNQYGGKVTSFFKTSSDPIQFSQSDALTNLINDGVSVISFFGHASGNTFDYSIDNASTYNNEGRYPVIFSFGCFSGNIHTSSRGISEDFVLTEKKGAVAFFSGTNTAFANTLFTYGQEFYSQLGGNSFGQGIGDIARITVKQQDPLLSYLGQQMTLNGDPSLRIGPSIGPDYIIDETSVVFDPNPISVRSETFDLTFDVVNLGRNVADSFLIEVRQELPDGTILTIVSDNIAAPQFRSTLNYNISTIGNESLGANKFYIEIDKNNQITEIPNPQAENNNTLLSSTGTEGVVVHMISNEVIPVFPEEFGIVNNPNLTLKASTSTTFLESQTYIMEIDTTELFNSPFKVRKEITQVGGIIKWKPEIPFSNNTVYYWRVSPEENPDVGGFVWKNSSFLYLAGSQEGWNQSHYHQFLKDRFVNMELPESNRLFKFISDFKEISADVYPIEPFGIMWYSYNNSLVDSYWGNPTGGAYVVVLDPVNIEPWENNNGNGGAMGSLGGGWFDFSFGFNTTNSAGREKLINFLNNEVPDDHYVLFYPVQKSGFSYFPEDWESDVNTLGTSIFDILEAEGATQVRNLKDTGSIPYLFFYQKGNGALSEEIASDINNPINWSYSISGNWDSGFIESTDIGPADTWENLEWGTKT